MSRHLIFRRFLLLIFSVCCFSKLYAQSLISLNDQWEFNKENQPSSKINIPHTWNDKDVLDDTPGYYRGLGIYKRKLNLDESLKNKQLFIVFNGVAQETEVVINGTSVFKHVGSYNHFIVPISKYVNYKNDIIEVKVNNRFNEDIAPLTADFTFFGGIYRNVSLLITDVVHFSKGDFASAGVYITTPKVTSDLAEIQIKNIIDNTSSEKNNYQLITTLLDADGKEVSSSKLNFDLKANEKKQITQDIKSIAKPKLWSPDEPYLYSVVSKIIDVKTKKVIDQVVNPLGFRWFSFDAEKGFLLNGKPLKLIGASRHQDYKDLGNAVPDALQIRDVELLKKMGGNFLRVAHYPQDPLILEACDRLGILASVEIPLVNAITETEAFTNNSLFMQEEMIKQNFNHPSVIIWAYMNEILLRPKFGNDKTRQEVYFENIRILAQKLEDLTRKLDPSRYTLLVNHGSFDLYNRVGLTKIPMIVGWNLYSGWYGGTLDDFAKYLDLHHKELKDKPVLITEYGADADPRIRSFQPVVFDKSVEYAIKYHQVYLNAMIERPFVAGGMAWNLADFNSETREETMPHINNKGLLTIGRQEKDTYYLYQAYLSKQPYLKLISSHWNNRVGNEDEAGNTSTQFFQVATNQKSAELFLNGKSLGVKNAESFICQWDVPFLNEKNSIKVVAANLSEQAEINFQVQPNQLNNKNISFKNINVLLGSKRFYLDELKHEVWQPDQLYKKGSWGNIGGTPYKAKNNRIQYGSDKNILNTDNDPIFQTQLEGIEKYQFDVPDGVYDLALYFSELVGGAEKEALAYNLDQGNAKEKAEQRIFNVYINNQIFLKDFNLAKDYGYAESVVKKTRIYVENGKGVQINFEKIEGKPVLNAIQLRKVY